MKGKQIFVIRDSKVESYLDPFYAVNKTVAIRMVQDAANDENSLLNKHPGDFEVFQVGKFYDTTGKVESTHHVSLGKVIDIIRPKNED